MNLHIFVLDFRSIGKFAGEFNEVSAARDGILNTTLNTTEPRHQPPQSSTIRKRATKSAMGKKPMNTLQLLVKVKKPAKRNGAPART